MCVSTVLTLTNRRAAISRVGNPWPMQSNTSSSRSLRVASSDVAAALDTNGVHDVIGGLLFHHEAHRTGAQGALGVQELVVHGKNEDGQLRVHGLDLAHEAQTAARAQTQVEEHDVG